jgi:UDP-glucose 4-epimerase
MRVLVTGGAGFIGSHVAESVLQKGWQVAIVDDLSAGNRDNIPDGAQFYEIDIRQRDAVLNVFREFQPHLVSHQAAQASVAVSVREPVLDAQINIMGSLNILDAAVEVGTDRVIFASTGGAIYGEVPDGVKASTATPPNPMSPYAASKFSVENYLRCYRIEHGLKFTVLRYSNVYGPRQDPHGEAGVVAIFCNRLLAGEGIRVNAKCEEGDDGCIRDYVFIGDVANANLAAMEGRIQQDVINICTGVETRTVELANEIQNAMGTDAEISYGPLRPGDVERSVLDPTELTAALGKPTGLERGVAQTVEWFRTKFNA